jgi:hypothetical protein
MYAVASKVEIDPTRAEDALDQLNSFTVPRAKALAGFVSGTWLRSEDGTTGRSVLLFESEDAARAAHARISEGPPPGAAAQMVACEVFEVLAQA